MAGLRVIDLGQCEYDAAEATQRQLRDELIRSTAAEPALLLCEHSPPVITLGRRGSDDDILAAPKALAVSGTQIRRVGRGGEATWHGSGQLVAYPIIRLGRGAGSIRRHVETIEAAIIETLAKLGLPARRRSGLIGVWVGPENRPAKIASVGVQVTRWVAWHGLALNVNCDMAGFGQIIPCGISGCQMTSLAAFGVDVSVEQVKPLLVEALRPSLSAGAQLKQVEA